MNWIQVTHSITLNNITPPSNFLMNLYFENSTVGLHVLYVLNIHANFHTNRMLFTIQFHKLSFYALFKLQKLEFIQLTDDMAINF